MATSNLDRREVLSWYPGDEELVGAFLNYTLLMFSEVSLRRKIDAYLKGKKTDKKPIELKIDEKISFIRKDVKYGDDVANKLFILFSNKLLTADINKIKGWADEIRESLIIEKNKQLFERNVVKPRVIIGKGIKVNTKGGIGADGYRQGYEKEVNEAGDW